MPARLYRRGDTWYVWGYDAAGARWSQSTRQRDKRAAETVARELERRRADPRYAAATATLERALEELLANAARRERAVRTLEFIRCKAGHLVRLLGRGRALDELTLDVTTAYLDRRVVEGAHRATVAKELGVLRSALRLSARHGRYDGDPRRMLPDGLADAYVPRERWLPVEEYRRLLAALTAERRDYLIAYCHLGVRRSELNGLVAGDVEIASRRLHVRGTKTDGSDRWVPLDGDAHEVLERRIERSRPGPLFPYWDSEVRDLGRACQRAGIERVSANDLRRTFASWLANAGVPESVVAKLLGHKDTTMVRRVYARLGVDIQRDAIAALPQVTSSAAGPRRTVGRAGGGSRHESANP